MIRDVRRGVRRDSGVPGRCAWWAIVVCLVVVAATLGGSSALAARWSSTTDAKLVSSNDVTLTATLTKNATGQPCGTLPDCVYTLMVTNTGTTNVTGIIYTPVSGFKLEQGEYGTVKGDTISLNGFVGTSGSASILLSVASGSPGAPGSSAGTVVADIQGGGTTTANVVNVLGPGATASGPATSTTQTKTTTPTSTEPATKTKSPSTTLTANDVRDVNTAIDDEQDALRALGSDYESESAAVRLLKYARDELLTVANKIDLLNNIVRIDLDRDLNMALTNDSDATASIERLTAIRAKTPGDYARIEAERDFAEKAIKEALVDKEAALSELDTLIKK
jgi:hypothetical protein